MIKEADTDGHKFDLSTKQLFGDKFKKAKQLNHERGAMLTHKERKAKKAARSAQVGFRTTDENKATAYALAKDMGLSVGKLYDLAIAELKARKEKDNE